MSIILDTVCQRKVTKQAKDSLPHRLLAPSPHFHYRWRAQAREHSFNFSLISCSACFETLRDELHRVNVGKIGDYDYCMSITTVRGYWRPLAGAKPYQGEIGQISEGYECKVEVNCKRTYIRDALKVIRAIHPYDEPLINVVPLVNHLFGETLPGA